MDSRKVFLKVHLYLGLASAAFLIILGLTGSIMAFESDIAHWSQSSLWYVSPGAQTLPESQLIQNVEQQFAPARVLGVDMPRQTNLAQVMALSGAANPREGRSVFVNPYTGAILGEKTQATQTEKTLRFIHQFHLRLASGKIGKTIMDFAGLILLLEVPLGVILWWRTKRASVQWKASGHRFSFDLHNALGIYVAAFLFLSALTGVLIGFDFAEPMIYGLTHSSRTMQGRPPQSTVVEGGIPIGIDKAMEIAKNAMPNATVSNLMIPGGPKGAYNVGMRVPEEVTDSVHSSVTIDQFSGQVLRTQNFMTDSLGYRVIRFNRALHTGDIFGTPTHLIMSLSSLLLVVMVITGVIIWWKKLAI